MPQGSKESYTNKQKRMARHIEDSAKDRGYSSKRAAEIGWATVNKKTGGAGKSTKSSKSKSKKSSSKSSGRKSRSSSHRSRTH